MMRRPAALVLPLLLLAGCSKHAVEEIETTAAVPVKIITLAPQTVEGIVAASGLVGAAAGADWVITAPEPARIIELSKAEGDRVTRGELLVRFEIPSATAEVGARRAEAAEAQARVTNAHANVTRLTTLVDHGVAAQKDLEDARRDLSEARAAVAQAASGARAAATVAARSTVRARFNGIVATRAHNPGDMVEASSADVILRVIDPLRLQVLAAVPIGDLARIKVGGAARVIVPGLEAPEDGTVLSRPAAVDPAGVSADVRISLNPSTRLAVGTPVRVEIVAEQRLRALAVPVDAILHEEDETFVMVAGPDSKAHKKKVSLGVATPELVEILGGVAAGEHVIVHGQQGLPDGAAIVIEK